MAIIEESRVTHIRISDVMNYSNIDSPTVLVNEMPNYIEIVEGIEEGSLYFTQTLVDKTIEFGKCTASRFEVHLYNLDEDVTGKEITVWQEIEIQEGTSVSTSKHYIFNGIIFSSKKAYNTDYREIVAYDKFYTLSNTDVASWWEEGLFDDFTIHSIRTALCYHFDIQADDSYLSNNEDINLLDYVNDDKLKFTKISFTAFLQYLSMLSCAIPYIAPTGSITLKDITTQEEVTFDGLSKIEFWKFPAENTAVDITNLFETENSDISDTTISFPTTIQFLNQDGKLLEQVPTTATDSKYTFAYNPFLSVLDSATPPQILTDAVMECFSQIFTNYLQYKATKIKMIVPDLSAHVGSLLKFKINNTYYYTYVFSQTLSGPLLIDQEFSCEGEEENTTQGTTSVGVPSNVGVEDTTAKKVKELNSTVSDISDNVDTLQGTVEGVQDDISDIQAEIPNLYGKTYGFPRIVYVNSASGNDNNAGTSSNPYKTLRKALSLYQVENVADLRIHFTNTSNTTYVMPSEYNSMVGVALHLVNDSTSGNTITVNFGNTTDDKEFAFYNCHLNVTGNVTSNVTSRMVIQNVPPSGVQSVKKTYFENCAIWFNIAKIDQPTNLTTFHGGSIFATNAEFTGPVDIRYSCGLLDDCSFTTTSDLEDALFIQAGSNISIQDSIAFSSLTYSASAPNTAAIHLKNSRLCMNIPLTKRVGTSDEYVLQPITNKYYYAINSDGSTIVSTPENLQRFARCFGQELNGVRNVTIKESIVNGGYYNSALRTFDYLIRKSIALSTSGNFTGSTIYVQRVGNQVNVTGNVVIPQIKSGLGTVAQLPFTPQSSFYFNTTAYDTYITQGTSETSVPCIGRLQLDASGNLNYSYIRRLSDGTTLPNNSSRGKMYLNFTYYTE